MTSKFLHLATTPAVAAMQERYLGRVHPVGAPPPDDKLGDVERGFIQARDSFYMATVTETGWPYVQHRGGPAGFLRVLSENKIGFADVRGNRQLLSTGNVMANNRVALFLMDYPQRSRLKILGHARVIAASENPTLAAELTMKGLGPAEYRAEATAGRAFLDTLRSERELNWTFLSPSALLEPGPRTGKFRVGVDQLLVDESGNSHISVADYAVAMIDELERPQHSRQRFTVGY